MIIPKKKKPLTFSSAFVRWILTKNARKLGGRHQLSFEHDNILNLYVNLERERKKQSTLAFV